MKKGTAIIGMIVTFLGGYFLRGVVGGPTETVVEDEGGPPSAAVQAAAGDVDRIRVPVGISNPFKGAKEAKVTLVEFSDFQ